MSVFGATVASPHGRRITSMDQFRGLTILLMFAVHYAGANWPINTRPVLAHNHYYLSVGDLAFPWFHFAAGFALRLSLLHRLDRDGSWAAYRRIVRRCLLLILLGDLPGLGLLGGWHVSHWGSEHRTDRIAQIATFVKFDGWTILAIIGVTSLWVLPAIGKSVRVRIWFLLAGLAVHALATQTFYLDFMNGRPNPVDLFLGTVGVHGREGGPLGFLVWAVPQIAGSFAYDVVVRHQPGQAVRQLQSAGIALVTLGYGLGSLSSLYPVAHGPQPLAYLYPETEQRTESKVLPRFTDHSARDLRAYFADPPFVPPPAERIRLWNYWMLSRRLATPTFMLTAIGFALIVYAAFVLLCDAGTFHLGLLRTLGQNPLIAYLLDGNIGGLVSDFFPESGGWAWAFAGAAARFGAAYVPVRLLEWRRLYLRL
jgi:predicted acyltransferase